MVEIVIYYTDECPICKQIMRILEVEFPHDVIKRVEVNRMRDYARFMRTIARHKDIGPGVPLIVVDGEYYIRPPNFEALFGIKGLRTEDEPLLMEEIEWIINTIRMIKKRKGDVV